MVASSAKNGPPSSGDDILARLSSVLQGVLIDQAGGRSWLAVAVSLRYRCPTSSARSRYRRTLARFRLSLPPALNRVGDTINFEQNLNVSAIDQRGVAEFFDRNQDLIAGHAVAGIRRSSAMRGAIR